MMTCSHQHITVYLESPGLQREHKAFVHVTCNQCGLELAKWLMAPYHESFAYIKTIQKGLKTLNDLTSNELNETFEVLSPKGEVIESALLSCLSQLNDAHLSAYERDYLQGYLLKAINVLAHPDAQNASGQEPTPVPF